MGDGVDTPQSSQLDCENPQVRNRKGAQSGLDTPKIVMTTRAFVLLKIYWNWEPFAGTPMGRVGWD